MQNKSAIWIFTILLAVACIYQLSFTFVTSGVEGDAEVEAQRQLDSLLNEDASLAQLEQEQAFQRFEQAYLLNMGNQEVYPLIGFTYDYCKRNEINLGLDLQGGMNVTLQVSVKDMLVAMSDNSKDEGFLNAIAEANEMQKNTQDDFVTLFEASWNESNPNGSLAAIFHNRENKERFPLEASNDDILETIREETDAAVSRTEQVLRKRIDNLGVVQPSIQRQEGTGRIIVELPGVKDKDRVRKLLQGAARLEFWETYENSEIYQYLSEANEMLALKMGLREDKAEASPDSTEAGSEPTEVIAESGDDSIDKGEALELVEDSNANDLEELVSAEGEEGLDGGEDNAQLQADFAKKNPLFGKLSPAIFQDENGQYRAGQGSVVGYALPMDTAEVNKLLARKDVQAIFPRRAKVLFRWDAKVTGDDKKFLRLHAIKTDKDLKAPLEGDVITNARVQNDQMGRPEVSISMNADGAKVWKNLTREAAGVAEDPSDNKCVAIVLDNLVYSAPQVQGEIAGGNTSISGSFTLQEAEDLAAVLKAGKLPAPARIIEEAIVGPTLGEEAISSGFMSFLLALVLILIYMAFYYSSAGLVADLALLANLFFVLGVLSSLGATLTLPGIAGIVLTIGMSVDANVLIYERIREELRAGKGVRLAIVDGYNNAYSSIIDANITTLLTGIILYVFGSGPIRGFATTLIIGIATSLFAAIFITRLLFEWRLDKNAKPSFSSKLTENILTNANFAFVKKRKTFYAISGVVILLGVGSLLTKGLNYGVDFTGGRSFIVRFDETVQTSEVAAALGDQFVVDGKNQTPEVKTYGSSNQVKITTKFLIDDDAETADDIVEAALKEGLKTVSPTYEIMSSQKVGPTIADDIKQGSVWAVLFSLLVIFLYIFLRFRKLGFAVGALVAMFHDVLIVLSLFSIFYGILPFSLEIDQAFIAAILTVVGYSINDTVVVFDRIREFVGLHKKAEYEGVVNNALNSTLTRTINTSLSTLVVLLMIFMFGGEVIRGFVFALIIGVVVGTYSSLFVASPIVVDLNKKKKA
jgi:SecD/SecF fusion protein